MKANSKRLYFVGCASVIILIVLVGIAVTASGVFGLRNNRFSNEQTIQALRTAEDQWTGNTIPHYHLQVSLSDDALFGGKCSYSSEVLNEEVIKSITNTCSFTPLVVSALFDWLQLEGERYDGRCGPNGCRCDGPIGLDVAFDPQHSYPYHAQFRNMHEFASQYRSFIDYIPGFERPCTLVGSMYPYIEDVQVTPIP